MRPTLRSTVLPLLRLAAGSPGALVEEGSSRYRALLHAARRWASRCAVGMSGLTRRAAHRSAAAQLGISAGIGRGRVMKTGRQRGWSLAARFRAVVLIVAVL